MSGQQHARLVGLLFWIFTGLNIALVAGIAALYVLVGVALSGAPRDPGTPDPAFLMSIILVVFALALLLTILFSIPKIVAGYGLRRQKPWARVWAIVACVISCLSFPLGTAIGVYGLVFLFGDDGKRYFEEVERAQLGIGDPLAAPVPDSWR